MHDGADSWDYLKKKSCAQYKFGDLFALGLCSVGFLTAKNENKPLLSWQSTVMMYSFNISNVSTTGA